MTADRPDRIAITVEAPAKLNLGLEVVGRRSDGFHELVTIFHAVSMLDRLTLVPDPRLRLVCADPTLAEDNLAMVALARLRDRAGVTNGAALRLVKGIPVAAGLGGASSDAASALLGARRLWRSPLPDAELANLAADLGSDVPFFLRGGAALATGRGELLTPLPPIATKWFVVVSPRVVIPRKTAALYAALTAADLSEGSRVRRQADRLRAARALDPDLLGNAFAEPLARLRPDLAPLPELMRREGATAVGLSGAGPSHYAVLDDQEAAARLAARLADRLGANARVALAAPWPHPPAPRTATAG